MQRKNFLIISGLSGGGKSLASCFFEDFGFFCIDNLPPALLPKLAQLFHSSHKENYKNVAVVIDIREEEFLDTLFTNLEQLKKFDINYKILFLEAQDEILLKRFKETRRRHPLGEEGDILFYIKKEKERMLFLREKADFIIDTSYFSPWDLKEKLKNIYRLLCEQETKLTVNLVAFGYKYGIPSDLDILFDVRFLPNPYYVPELVELCGDEPKVINYLLSFEETRRFLQILESLLEFLLPEYEKEGKVYLNIGIGCTGGKHRSIAVAKLIKDFIEKKDKKFKVILIYRDIEKHASARR